MTYRLRDSITIWEDKREPGEDLPKFDVPKYQNVPATIKQISGDETWRGRQLEEHVDFVVTLWFSSEMQIATTDLIQVVAGWSKDRWLNIRWARTLEQDMGRPRMFELYCRESTDI